MIKVHSIVEGGILFEAIGPTNHQLIHILTPTEALDLQKQIQRGLAEWSQLTRKYVDSGKKKGGE